MGRKFSYIDMMRATPAKIIYNKRPEKHSEMLKPYKHDGYQEMEYFYPDYNWNMDFDFDLDLTMPTFDGNIEAEIEDAPNRNNEGCCDYGLVGDCWWYSSEIIRNCDKEKSVSAAPLDEFIGISVDGPIALVRWNKARFVLIEAGISGETYGIRGKKGEVSIKVLKRAHGVTPCICDCKMEVTIPSDCAECTCPPAIPLAFDDANTPNTIAPGGSITVIVTDGCPPITWASSGNGITFDVAATEGRTNSLTSASGVCGVDYDPTTTLTMTDACGTSVQATILSTGGSWSTTDTMCGTNQSYTWQCQGSATGNIRYGMIARADNCFPGTLCTAGCCDDAINNAGTYGFSSGASCFACCNDWPTCSCGSCSAFCVNKCVFNGSNQATIGWIYKQEFGC